MTVQIRLATREDLPQVVTLLAQLSLDGEHREGDPHDPRYVAQFEAMRGTGGLLFVATVDHTCVATATLHVLARVSLKASTVGLLENVAVDQAHRGLGVGAQLVRHVIAVAREAGCQRLELTSRLERSDAHRFWQRCGFTPSHRGFKQWLVPND